MRSRVGRSSRRLLLPGDSCNNRSGALPFLATAGVSSVLRARGFAGRAKTALAGGRSGAAAFGKHSRTLGDTLLAVSYGSSSLSSPPVRRVRCGCDSLHGWRVRHGGQRVCFARHTGAAGEHGCYAAQRPRYTLLPSSPVAPFTSPSSDITVRLGRAYTFRPRAWISACRRAARLYHAHCCRTRRRFLP